MATYLTGALRRFYGDRVLPALLRASCLTMGSMWFIPTMREALYALTLATL
jgi:hypothetical protein